MTKYLEKYLGVRIMYKIVLLNVNSLLYVGIDIEFAMGWTCSYDGNKNKYVISWRILL